MYEPVVYLYTSVIKIRYVTIVSNNTYTNENVFFYTISRSFVRTCFLPKTFWCGELTSSTKIDDFFLFKGKLIMYLSICLT